MVGKSQGVTEIIAGLEIHLLEVGVGLQKENAVHHGVRPVVVGHAQLLVGAEHPIGLHTTEDAFRDMDAPGEVGVMQCHRDEIPLVQVLGTGDDLDGGGLSYIHLTDPHVVGVFMTGEGEDSARHHVFHLTAGEGGDLNLGAGEGHGLIEFPVRSGDGYEFIEPFTT